MHRLFLLSILSLAGAAVLFTATRQQALAHCEVPCGIYDDHARVVAMLEDADTCAKAIDQINALAGKTDAQSLNQATRWVMNKESHATKIQDTMAQYFLTQRVKPVAPDSDKWPDYVARVTKHHAVMVAAMKVKQGVDPQSVDALRAAIHAIAPYYPKKEVEKKVESHSHGDDQDHDHDHGDQDHDHK